MSTWAPFCLYQTVFAPDNSACLGVVLQCNDRTDENVAACFDLLDGVAVLTRGLLQWMHQFAEGNWEAFTAAGAGCTSVEACYVWLALLSAKAAGLSPAEANFSCLVPSVRHRKDLAKLLKANAGVLQDTVKQRRRDPFLKAFGEFSKRPANPTSLHVRTLMRVLVCRGPGHGQVQGV
jgi:hypothetical protein